jgi:hypothetical protein
VDIITYSSGTCLCHCEQKYCFRYEQCLVPKRDDSEARWVGSAMHAGQEALAKGGMDAALKAIDEWASRNPVIGECQFARQQEQVCKAKAMVRASAEKWPGVVDPDALVEHVVEMPVVNPKTGRRNRKFTFNGKFDGLAKQCLHDWKNTSDPLRTIREKVIGFQTELYTLGARLMGKEVTSAQFRVIARPSLQFQKSGVHTKKYAGDVKAYEQACYEWLLESPDRMVESPESMINPARLDRARVWLWNCVQRIIHCRKTGVWQQNELACHSWNRVCEYMPICEAMATGADVEWVKDQMFDHREPHDELKSDATEGKEETEVKREVYCPF